MAHTRIIFQRKKTLCGCWEKSENFEVFLFLKKSAKQEHFGVRRWMSELRTGAASAWVNVLLYSKRESFRCCCAQEFCDGDEHWRWINNKNKYSLTSSELSRVCVYFFQLNTKICVPAEASGTMIKFPIVFLSPFIIVRCHMTSCESFYAFLYRRHHGGWWECSISAGRDFNETENFSIIYTSLISLPLVPTQKSRDDDIDLEIRHIIERNEARQKSEHFSDGFHLKLHQLEKFLDFFFKLSTEEWSKNDANPVWKLFEPFERENLSFWITFCSLTAFSASRYFHFHIFWSLLKLEGIQAELCCGPSWFSSKSRSWSQTSTLLAIFTSKTANKAPSRWANCKHDSSVQQIFLLWNDEINFPLGQHQQDFFLRKKIRPLFMMPHSRQVNVKK